MYMDIDLHKLARWELFLDAINSTSYVPEDALAKALSIDHIAYILGKKTKSESNLPYLGKGSHVSLRYLNDAWFWAQVISLKPSYKSVVELCCGPSLTIDLALSYCNYKDIFYKVDYNVWSSPAAHVITRDYTVKPLYFNVITQTGETPLADILVLNHAIDDLFMGLWQEKRGISDYFMLFNEAGIPKLDDYWRRALNEEVSFINKIYEILRSFVLELPSYLTPGGLLVIRDYPCAYETWRKHIDRINFTRSLTIRLASELIAHDLVKCLGVNFKDLSDDQAEQVSDTFFVFQKQS
jgi:hypothetical protein